MARSAAKPEAGRKTRAKPGQEGGKRRVHYSRPEMKRLLEAILFSADRPVPAPTLCSMLSGAPEKDLRDALEEMSREYEETGRSFILKEVGGGFLLLTHPAFEPWVRKLYRGRLTMRLSRSALETVAVIAYRQPVTRQGIESIRGVNVDAVLNTLLDRKLIRIVGRDKGVGRPILYGTTREFLMFLGLNDLNELPQIEEMKAILESREVPTAVTDEHGPFAAVADGEAPPAGDAAAPEPPPATAPAPETPIHDAEDEESDDDEDEDDEEKE